MASKLEHRTMVEVPDREGFLSFAKEHRRSGYLALGPAYQSYKLGRSTNSVSILLLGMKGSGKSLTINNLFSKEIVPVGGEVSCAEEFVEFTVRMPSEHTGISNAEIHVIGTPEFGDTKDEIGFDERVLYNVRKLFDRKNYTPNFIFFTINISDGRLDGEADQLVQLFQSFKAELAKVVLDTKHPNLIIVLTHLCAAKTELQKDPSSIKALVNKLVRQNLGIPDVSVEVAENRFQEWDRKKVGDYVELPNKELFPRNLYRSMMTVAKGKDPVGYGIFNEAYAKLPSGDFSVSSTPYLLCYKPHERSQPIVVSGDVEKTDPEKNEILELLSQEWEKLPEEVKSKTEIREVSRSLLNSGTTSIDTLPRTNKDTISFLQKLNPDKGTEMLLRKSFGLKAPDFSYLDLKVGKAYDITKDMITRSVISPDLETLHLSKVGCYLPKHIQASYCRGENFICNVSRTTEEMTEQRLKALKLQVSCGKVGFNFECQDGQNVLSRSASNTISAVYEKKLIQLVLKDGTPLSPDMEKAVKKLPGQYDNADPYNVQQWKSFFSKYGSHYIKSAHIGGSVVFKVTEASGSRGLSDTQSFQSGISGFLSHIFSPECSVSSSSSTSTASSARKLEIVVNGGSDNELSRLTLKNTEDDFWHALSAWEETIWESPTVTNHSVGIDQVANLVDDLDPNVVIAMTNAIEDLYGARLQCEAVAAEPTRGADSMANRSYTEGSCLTPETLISTPDGSVPIKTLRAGDSIINQKGQSAKIIGVNKVYSIGTMSLYGFLDATTIEGSKPFFTSGHTFLSPSGNLLVQNKYLLELGHPQMKSEFQVEEMPTGEFQVFTLGQLRATTRTVPGLTSVPIEEGQELYFLAVDGDGTYVANGFVCYHELPKFEAWPKTFAAIYEAISDGEHEKQELTLDGFKDLLRVSEEIKTQWEILAINRDHAEIGANGESRADNFEKILQQLGSALGDSYQATLGLMLYSQCGELLHRHLDIEGMAISPFVKEAHNILQRKF